VGCWRALLRAPGFSCFVFSIASPPFGEREKKKANFKKKTPEKNLCLTGR
jgi:hypothetical protein